VLLYYAR